MSPAAAIPNPFVYGRVLIPGKPFCSRPQLESSVLEAATHQQRIVLLGERRMGKSSLVEHTLTRPDRVLVAVDLRGLESVEDFIDRLLLRLSTTLEAHREMRPRAFMGCRVGESLSQERHAPDSINVTP
jgi:hypothetical protein